METVKRKSGLRYREKIYINGKAVNSPYFIRKSDARAWKRRKTQERDQCIAIGLAHIVDISLEAYYLQYMERNSDRAWRTQEYYKGIFENHILPILGKVNLRELRLHHGEELKSILKKKELGIRRINNILVALKTIVNDAVKFDYLIRSPFKALSMLKKIPSKSNYWLREEVNKFLMENRNEYYYPLFVVALNLGLRKGEILGLQLSQLDFVNKQISISNTLDRKGLKSSTKNYKVRVMAMNEVVEKVLLDHLKSRLINSEFVFTKPCGEPIDYSHFTERIFYKAIEKAGVKRITFHECRKSFASNFMMGSGDLYALKNLLGHQSIEVTQKAYAHLHPQYLKEQSNIVSFSGDNKLSKLELVDNA